MKRLEPALLLAALLCASAVSPAAAEREIVGTARVIDGHTLEIDGMRIRLFAVDAPDRAQTCERPGDPDDPCGRRSATALRELIEGREIRCEERRREGDNLIAAICYDGLADINAAMVRQGHAIAYLRDSRAYLPEQRAARQAKRGLWAGNFQTPADWRREFPRR